MTSVRDSGSQPAVSSSARTATDRRRRLVVRVVSVCVAVASIAIFTYALTKPAATGPAANAGTVGTPAPAAPKVGHYAPDVTLLDLRNQNVALSSLRGKVVLLNFWYVACAPCQYEMPALQKAYDTHEAKGLVVVGVDVGDDSRTVSQFLNQLGITYPILRDVGERAVVQYQLTATPTSFFIDRQGVIRYKVLGPLDTPTLNTNLTALLGA
jgi:peroxiredoxin